MRGWFEQVVDGSGGPAGVLLRPALRVASGIYSVAIGSRNARYDRGARRICHVDAPVVSIGNITTGGTGKTPMTIHVVERLRAQGRKPAVVARGYAARGGRPDELHLIEKVTGGVPCVANPDRVAGAREALAGGAADVIVLDDGFQHRRIARNLDIVLLDATAPFGGGYLLPRGRLREPVQSLCRADAVVLTRTDQLSAHLVSNLRGQVGRMVGVKPVLACAHRPQQPYPLLLGPEGAAHVSPVESVFLVSAIARPEAFERTVHATGLEVRAHARFPDHHRFTPGDAAAIARRVVAAGARRILITEKDAVKLAELAFDWPVPVDVLPVRIDFPAEDATMLDDLLRTLLDQWQPGGPGPS